MRRAAAAALLALLLGGCGTILSLSPHEGGLSPYGGVRLDAVLISEGVVPLLVLDVPFSAVLDTLLLPLSIPLWLAEDDDVDTHGPPPAQEPSGSTPGTTTAPTPGGEDPLAPR